MKLVEDYKTALQAIYDHVGLEENWVVCPIDDRLEMYWTVDNECVKYADSKEDLEGENDNYYEDEIYRQRHYKQHVYEGTEVKVVKKLEDGWLAQHIYTAWYDEYGDVETISDDIQFFKELFENAPTQKYAEEVNLLKLEAEKLEQEVQKLTDARTKEKLLMNKIMEFPIVQQMADYLTGDYSYVLFLSKFDIKRKSEICTSKKVRTDDVKSNGIPCLYAMDSSDIAFLVFKTKDEAITKALELLKAALLKYTYSYYDAVSNFNSWWNTINKDLKTDEVILDLYRKKLDEAETKTKLKKQEDLDKKIAELEKAKQDLAKLV